jgi:hypothetical protein
MKKRKMKALRAAHQLRVEAVMRAVPDYNRVLMRMSGVTVSDEFIQEVMRSDRSAEVAYYLASSRTAFEVIEDLEGRELTFAIGRITGILDARKVTTMKAHEAQLSAWLDKKYPSRKKSLPRKKIQVRRRR